MVFTIGQDQHHTARLALRVEGVHGQGQRRADGGPLERDGFRANRVEEELDGGQVLREGRLHIGLSSKHDEPDPVPVELLNDPLNAALGQVQTGHAHIFREHRSAHVERNHDVHALGFHLLHAGAPFGVHQAHGQQGDAGAPDQELPDGPAGAGIGPKRPAEFQFGGFGHPPLFPAIMAGKEQQPDRRHQQGGPGTGVMQVQLGGHLPQENGEGHQARPENQFEEDQSRDVGKHLVCSGRGSHGKLRMKRWRTTASAARHARANQPTRGNSSVFLLYRKTLNRVFSRASISV